MKTHINYFNSLLFKILPETRCFILKTVLLRLAGVKIGKNVRICSSARIIGNGQLSIGDNTWIGSEAIIISSSSIIIGCNVDIGPRVYIGTGTHEMNSNSLNAAGNDMSLDVMIEDGCWLGVNSTILPGTILRAKSILAACSVLTKKMDRPNLLLAGVPASIKKVL
jgi:acetyltransferase-like isoleucine patch superfamily enzyme